jgi:hypothetical protein
VVAASGALISEYGPGDAPLSWHFPHRNRIIAALSSAVVVVEARVESGALSTARWALDLGREAPAVLRLSRIRSQLSRWPRSLPLPGEAAMQGTPTLPACPPSCPPQAMT